MDSAARLLVNWGESVSSAPHASLEYILCYIKGQCRHRMHACCVIEYSGVQRGILCGTIIIVTSFCNGRHGWGCI